MATTTKKKSRPVTAESIIAAIQRHGSDAADLRDAAHEASHALQMKVPCGEWDRETIHGCLMDDRGWEASTDRVFLVRSELLARAVEQLVCATVGVSPDGAIEHWAMISCMEAIKLYRIDFGRPQQLAKAIEFTMKSDDAKRIHDQILALR